MLIIVITIALLLSAWLAYELYRAPFMDDEGNIDDDPTTTFWHEKD